MLRGREISRPQSLPGRASPRSSRLDFSDARRVAPALEVGGEEQANNLTVNLATDHPFTERENVGVVVLTGEACCGRIPAEGATDASDLVGDNLLPVSGATEDNAA